MGPRLFELALYSWDQSVGGVHAEVTRDEFGRPGRRCSVLNNSDSDSEKINTALQRPAGETIVAESSSDSESEVGGGGDESESEVPQTEDDDRKRAESSDTESEDGPDIDTSRDVTPAPPPKASDIRLPPENLDSGKLKKLETMKESAA